MAAKRPRGRPSFASTLAHAALQESGALQAAAERLSELDPDLEQRRKKPTLGAAAASTPSNPWTATSVDIAVARAQAQPSFPHEVLDVFQKLDISTSSTHPKLDQLVRHVLRKASDRFIRRCVDADLAGAHWSTLLRTKRLVAAALVILHKAYLEDALVILRVLVCSLGSFSAL